MRRILLVNPPIYDFAAYDFGSTYGLLSVAGRCAAGGVFLDYLDEARGGNCGLRISRTTGNGIRLRRSCRIAD
jgi:hypothetical protein